jgi:hypothetical protein
MKPCFSIALILLGVIILCGCSKEKLPKIYTTHWEMQNPVQVTAQFKQFVEFTDKGRTYMGYTFLIIEPEQYKSQEVSIGLHWKEFDPNKLIPGKKYLVTVPRENIGTKDLVCDWGLEYKEPK